VIVFRYLHSNPSQTLLSFLCKLLSAAFGHRDSGVVEPNTCGAVLEVAKISAGCFPATPWGSPPGRAPARYCFAQMKKPQRVGLSLIWLRFLFAARYLKRHVVTRVSKHFNHRLDCEPVVPQWSARPILQVLKLRRANAEFLANLFIA
jgi:hypothetical protein